MHLKACMYSVRLCYHSPLFTPHTMMKVKCKKSAKLKCMVEGAKLQKLLPINSLVILTLYSSDGGSSYLAQLGLA